MKILKRLVSRRHLKVSDAASLTGEALDQLPEHYRLPVWLHCGENMTLDEVAEVLSVPEKMARARMMRGMDILTEALRRLGMESPLQDVRTALCLLTQCPAPVRLHKDIELLVRDHGREPWR